MLHAFSMQEGPRRCVHFTCIMLHRTYTTRRGAEYLCMCAKGRRRGAARELRPAWKEGNRAVMEQRGGVRTARLWETQPLCGAAPGMTVRVAEALRAWDRGSGERPANTHSLPEYRLRHITRSGDSTG